MLAEERMRVCDNDFVFLRERACRVQLFLGNENAVMIDDCLRIHLRL